jgi:hypothetical protein
LWVSGDAGPYAFRLLDAATAQPFTLGSTVQGTNTPASALTLWRFTASAKEPLFYQVLSRSGFTGTPVSIVYTPCDTVLARHTTDDQQSLVASVEGTYTVVVTTPPVDTGTRGIYGFKLLPVPQSTQALVIGTTVSGSISSPGEEPLYTFSLASPTRLSLDTLTNANAYLTLSGPTGNLYDRTLFFFFVDAGGRRPVHGAFCAQCHGRQRPASTRRSVVHRPPQQPFGQCPVAPERG